MEDQERIGADWIGQVTIQVADRGDFVDSPPNERNPLTTAQIAEIERRVADDDANPDDVVPGEEVIAAALMRVGSQPNDGGKLA